MKILGVFALAAAVLAPLTGVDASVEGPADKIQWMTSWEEAVALSKKEKRPIMIHFNMDDEPACQGMARGHFKNKELVELSRSFVCVVGSLGDHASEDIVTDEPGKCRRFGTVTCAEHRTCEPGARGDVLAVQKVTAPQFVFTDPDLNILVRKPWDTSPGDVIKLMKRALTYFNPSMEPADVAAKRKELIRDLLTQADSDNTATRQKAMDVLATRDDPEIIDFLIKQTREDVDEVKRLAAIDAIGAAANSNCLGRLIELLGDRSSRIRRNSIVALNTLGMVEAIAPMLKKFRNDNNERNQALIVRACVTCGPDEVEVRKLVGSALKHRDETIRAHAIRACLTLNPVDKEYERILKMSRSESDTTVKRIACHASVRLLLDSKGVDGDSAAKILKNEKKLISTLKGLVRGAKPEVRAYAELCLAAAVGEDEDLLYEDTSEFFDEGALFETDDLSGQRAGRGGRGGGR